MQKLYAVVSLVLLLTGCNPIEKVNTQMSNVQSHQMLFVLSSSAFKNNETIPLAHTCDGANESPQLSWKHAPERTKYFALICEDPDAPREKPFVHWLVYNIPAHINELSEGVPTTEQLNFGTEFAGQGTNDAQRTGYYGPCPPSGTHRYYFKLYALDNKLALEPAATLEQLQAAMKGHIIGSCELLGMYQRKK
jgi:Raf kinase inhibitor-like YbhB/YbcL family protein